MRPASGCSCEGSGSDSGERKEDTSAAVVGSKGSGSKSVEEGEEEEDEEGGEERRPVRVSQNDDMVSVRVKNQMRWKAGWCLEFLFLSLAVLEFHFLSLAVRCIEPVSTKIRKIEALVADAD